MNFPPLQLTDEGKGVLIKALTNNADTTDTESITFTRIAIGDGEEPTDAAKLTALQNEIISVDITSIEQGENFVTLKGMFDNVEHSDYYAHEMGVFAQNSDGSEKLYAYSYESNTADYIPSYSQSGVETTLNVIVAIGEAKNVDAILTDGVAYADKRDFEAHLADETNPHKVTAEQVGLGNVENLSVSDGVPTMSSYSTLQNLTAGDKMSTLFGKLKYAVKQLIAHINNKSNPHSVTYSQVGAAKSSHTHAASDITSGILSVARGGTGTSTTGGALDNLGAVGRKGTGGYAEVFNATSVNVASGDWSHAEGYGTIASGQLSHAEGWKSSATSYESHAEGYQTTASGLGAHAEGRETVASGEQSHAEGYQTNASGSKSHSEGCITEASGDYSHAAGYNTTASGSMSHSEGWLTKATAQCAHASGFRTIADKNYQTAIGYCNESSNGYFVVGGGAYYSEDNITRTNAFRVGTNGYCYGQAAFVASGADFAEMFEWADGNPENEDRRGLFVTLDGDKIRLANTGDEYILGVVSAAPTIVGNTASEDWQGRFKTDVFGERLTETVTIPESTDENGVTIPERTETHFILNENYDDSKKYVPREQRKEWSAVGLVGQLVVTDDGTCKANGYCTVGKNGKATQNQTGYRVMKRLDDTHIRIIYRAEAQ